MKGLIYSICLFLICTISCQALSCQTAVERDKRAMREIYSCDENYITLTGEVIEIKDDGYDGTVVIKCEDLKLYIANEEDECEYWIFSNSKIDLEVGDVIEYITVNVRYNRMEWLPIVAISKNDENILDFEEGKKNLIDWVNQLQMK